MTIPPDWRHSPAHRVDFPHNTEGEVAEALNRRYSVRRSCGPIAALHALRLMMPMRLRLGGKSMIAVVNAAASLLAIRGNMRLSGKRPGRFAFA
jgi:hypothetical protein